MHVSVLVFIDLSVFKPKLNLGYVIFLVIDIVYPLSRHLYFWNHGFSSEEQKSCETQILTQLFGQGAKLKELSMSVGVVPSCWNHQFWFQLLKTRL
jgi:hypothetical protein